MSICERAGEGEESMILDVSIATSPPARAYTHRQLIRLAPFVASLLHHLADLHDLRECTSRAHLDGRLEGSFTREVVARTEFEPEQRDQVGGVHLVVVEEVMVGWRD